MMIKGILIWSIVAFGAALMAAFLASWKNRDYSFWAAWCFLLPPLLLVLALLPKNVGPTPRQPTLDQLDRNEDRVL